MSEREQAVAIADLKSAIAFLDKVKSASADERIAVGRDHWDWLESAARKVATAFPDCPNCDGSGYVVERMHSERSCDLC